jgi:hypothetical protein
LVRLADVSRKAQLAKFASFIASDELGVEVEKFFFANDFTVLQRIGIVATRPNTS